MKRDAIRQMWQRCASPLWRTSGDRRDPVPGDHASRCARCAEFFFLSLVGALQGSEENKRGRVTGDLPDLPAQSHLKLVRAGSLSPALPCASSPRLPLLFDGRMPKIPTILKHCTEQRTAHASAHNVALRRIVVAVDDIRAHREQRGQPQAHATEPQPRPLGHQAEVPTLRHRDSQLEFNAPGGPEPIAQRAWPIPRAAARRRSAASPSRTRRPALPRGQAPHLPPRRPYSQP